jgi:hypothetical protein
MAPPKRIRTCDIKDGAITQAKLASAAAVEAATVTNAEISASAAIALSKLATGDLPAAIKVKTANLAAANVTATELAADAVVDVKVAANAAIALTKLADGALKSTITLDPGLMVQSAVIVVSSAELKALNTTAKTLIASPGAGNAIQFLSAVVMHDYATAAYTESNANLEFRYTDKDGAICGTGEATGFLDATADKMIAVAPAASPLMVANAALVLAAAANPAGSGTGVLRCRVTYRVVPFQLS